MRHYVLVIEGDTEPNLRGPFGSPAEQLAAAQRLRAADLESRNGIFALNVPERGHPRVLSYSYGALHPDGRP